MALDCATRTKMRAGFQTRTIGNDSTAKLLIAHNLESCLSGFNSRRRHRILQGFGELS
jgi:hypothetical protein